MSKNEPFQFRSGMDQSTVPYQADTGSFWFLQNCRMSPDIRGTIEQTPYFNLFLTETQGTYWDGAASATEPTTSAVRGIIRDIYVTDYVCWASTTQLQVFQQVTQPTAENVNTGCLIVVNSTTGLALTLGNTLDIVIDGATTFKWRKNGGGYTALVPITTGGVSIDGGNVTVYFLASTGFTVNDQWQWRRTDGSFEVSGGSAVRSTKPCDWTYYKGTLYFRNISARICACKWAVSSANLYVITAGYRAVYGDNLTFYDDHMIVSRYATSVQAITYGPRAKVVGWSDKTDVENFIPTDINEADQYTMPNVVLRDTANTNGSDSLVESVTVLKQQLFVITTYEVYYSPALGLPTVFSFKKFMDLPKVDATSTINVLEAKDRVYIWTQTGLYTFDGGDLSYIGGPVKPYFFVTEISRNQLQTPSAGTYNRYSQEIYFSFTLVTNLSQPFLLVYSEITKQFHIRASDFSSDAQPVTAMSADSGTLLIGGTSRKIFSEDAGYQSSPVYDYTDGTVYATPIVTFQALSFGTLRQEKEITGVYVGASVVTAGTPYSTGVNLKLDLAYRDCPVGLISGSSTVSSATWDTSLVDGSLTFRRPFRALSLELQARGATAGKPPGKFILTAFEPQVTLPKNLLDR